MMVWSINLFVLAIGFLIVGMFKPQWLLFWMDRDDPPRMPIVFMSMILFMAGATMFGQANLDKNSAMEAAKASKKVEEKVDTLPIIKPEIVKPEIVKEAPKQPESQT